MLKPPSFVNEADLAAFRLLRAAQRAQERYGSVRLDDANALALLRAAPSSPRTRIIP